MTSASLHTMWWSGNLYEAVVIAPAWPESWRRGPAPDVRIDPRQYYVHCVLAPRH